MLLSILIAAAAFQPERPPTPPDDGRPRVWVYCVAEEDGQLIYSPATTIQAPPASGPEAEHGRAHIRQGGRGDPEPGTCVSFPNEQAAKSNRGRSLAAARGRRGGANVVEGDWTPPGQRRH